jgi:hypothetical protein
MRNAVVSARLATSMVRFSALRALPTISTYIPLRKLSSSSSSEPQIVEVGKDYDDVEDEVAQDKNETVFWSSLLGEDHVKTFQSRKVRIFEPGHHAMQNMPEKDLWNDNKRWVMDFEPKEIWNNNLMGWTSTRDPMCNLRIRFPSIEKAIKFAEKHGMHYTVYPAHEKKVKGKSYAWNFKWKGNP